MTVSKGAGSQYSCGDPKDGWPTAPGSFAHPFMEQMGAPTLAHFARVGVEHVHRTRSSRKQYRHPFHRTRSSRKQYRHPPLQKTQGWGTRDSVYGREIKINERLSAASEGASQRACSACLKACPDTKPAVPT